MLYEIDEIYERPTEKSLLYNNAHSGAYKPEVCIYQIQ
jgi:hypothetical protein